MRECVRLSRSSSPGRYFSREEGERERGEAPESPATPAPQPSSPSALPPGAAAASRVSGAGARALEAGARPRALSARRPGRCADAGGSARGAGGRAGCVRPTPRGRAVPGSRCSSGSLKGWNLEVSMLLAWPPSASPSPFDPPHPPPLCPCLL